MRFTVRVGDVEKAAVVNKTNGVYEVTLDDRTFKIDCVYFGDTGFLSMLIDNESYLIETAPVDAEKGRYYAAVMGRHYDVDVLDELLVAAREAEAVSEHTGAYNVTAPMPGLVVDIKVAVGDEVTAGSAVVIMEAMKMQNELSSEVDGVVTAVHVAPQQTVDSQAALVTIERK